MTPMMLFTDGSVHPPSRVGYGAYLTLTDINNPGDVHTRRFENTSSSQLEIETLIWALQTLPPKAVTVYTDSQTIMRLLGRRTRFEERNYRTQRNQPVRHADLYRQFFRFTDSVDCTFVKVKGHRRSHQKSDIDRLFSLVDRASRRALRLETHCI